MGNLWEHGGRTRAKRLLHVAGSMDNYEVMKRFVGRAPAICRLPGLTAIQASDVVRRYLSEHPELRHNSAASLIFVAMAEVFPCAATAPR